MTLTALRREQREARKAYRRHPHDRAGANYRRYVLATAAVMKAELARKCLDGTMARLTVRAA